MDLDWDNFVWAKVKLPSPLPQLINEDQERDTTPSEWIVKILTDYYSKGGSK